MEEAQNLVTFDQERFQLMFRELQVCLGASDIQTHSQGLLWGHCALVLYLMH